MLLFVGGQYGTIYFFGNFPRKFPRCPVGWMHSRSVRVSLKKVTPLTSSRHLRLPTRRGLWLPCKHSIAFGWWRESIRKRSMADSHCRIGKTVTYRHDGTVPPTTKAALVARSSISTVQYCFGLPPSSAVRLARLSYQCSLQTHIYI